MKRNLLLVIISVLLIPQPAFSQRSEVGLLVGGLKSTENQFEEFPAIRKVTTDASLAVQFNYAFRLFDVKALSLYIEAPLVAIPRTKFNTTTVFFPRSYRTILFTPGVKMRILPKARLSPYAAVGAGLAHLEPSEDSISGQFDTGHGKKTWAYDIGGGVDIRISSWIGIRGELRDFHTRTPEFLINLFKDRQHNIVTMGGIVFRF